MTSMVRTIVFITLFIALFAACGGEPTQQSLYLPKDADTGMLRQADPKHVFNLVLVRDAVFYYGGNLTSAEQARKTNIKGIRDQILNAKRAIGDSLLVLIKASETATYKNTVDMLDEMTINEIKKYAMIGLTKKEAELLQIPGNYSD